MTKEERVFIEAKDLTEIELSCGDPDCASKTRVSLSLLAGGIQLPNICPSCNKEWFSPGSGDPHKTTLLNLVAALRELRKPATKKFGVRFRVHTESVS